ncbi:MAG: aminodeoxychorismate synthase component I, partial [Pseudomonadota bacterium]|nr:aminodeoxychorismate synthase component I [Pseudomonadota bacterium]
ILRKFRKPVLGVCLGHQGIAHFAGGKVRHAPEPMHGRTSRIRHNGEGLFAGIRSPFNAVRYHSYVAEDLPEHLHIDATTDDGLVMALHHTELPFWGVQFHPESVATEHGQQIIANFLRLAGAKGEPLSFKKQLQSGRASLPDVSTHLKALIRKLELGLSSEGCFEILYGQSEKSFWLDSSSHANQQGRYSFMGDASGPLSHTLSYDVTRRQLGIAMHGVTETRAESIFDYLARRGDEVACVNAGDIPVPFKGGYVGYLGYELKADCGGRHVHESPQADAQLVFADRYIAFDHETDEAWAVCLVKDSDEQSATEWFDQLESALRDSCLISKPAFDTVLRNAPSDEPWQQRHSRAQYLSHIQTALDKIRDGESYEICLCNEWTKRYDKAPLGTYREIRALNPAPYSAFLRFDDLSVVSCSPERMVRISETGEVNCKPIKGTIARGQTRAEDAALKQQLLASEKDRAENLMIVDLIRNDLNRVCQTGSVDVPKLGAIESCATVHQMVSTVTGELRPDETAVSCVRSLFPGGSMTGAPKVRTMEIIDELEKGPRGVYSGAIGYFSIDGAVDLNIVIRTIVLKGDRASIGAGGAIVALSDPEDEYAETQLKGEVLRNALMTLDPVNIEVATHPESPAAAE